MAILDRFEHAGVEGIRTGRMNKINMSFIVYRYDDCIIDVGPTNQWKYLKPFFQEKAIREILITHHHDDHSGNSANLAKLTGLMPLGSNITQDLLTTIANVPWLQKLIWGSNPRFEIDEFKPAHHLSDGSKIDIIPAPGHTVDLNVFHIPDKGWLFSGDLYISGKLKYMHQDEDLPTMLASLRNVLTLDFDTLFCPHRGVVTDGKAALQSKLNYLIDLSGRAQLLWQQGEPINIITTKLLGKEDLTSKLSGYTFCKSLLVKQCLRVEL